MVCIVYIVFGYCLRYFPKGSQGYFPKSQLSKCAYFQAATSAKSVLAAELPPCPPPKFAAFGALEGQTYP